MDTLEEARNEARSYASYERCAYVLIIRGGYKGMQDGSGYCEIIQYHDRNDVWLGVDDEIEIFNP